MEGQPASQQVVENSLRQEYGSLLESVAPIANQKEESRLTPRLIDHLAHSRNTDELLKAFDIVDASFTLPDAVQAIGIFSHSEHGRSGQQAYLAVSTLETVLQRTEHEGQTEQETAEQRELVQQAFQSMQEMLPGVLASPEQTQYFRTEVGYFRQAHPQVAEISDTLFATIGQDEEDDQIPQKQEQVVREDQAQEASEAQEQSPARVELSPEEKQEIDTALAILQNISPNDEQRILERTQALNTIFSFRNRALPYLQERLLPERREIELSQFINNLAEEDDLDFVLQTLADPAIDHYPYSRDPADIASRTLISMMHNMRLDHGEQSIYVEKATNTILRFLQEHPQLNTRTQFNCRNALSIADTIAAKMYLARLQAGTEYLSADTIYTNWPHYIAPVNMFPSEFPMADETTSSAGDISTDVWDMDTLEDDYSGSPVKQTTTADLKNYTMEQWQQDIRRLIRRAAIDRHLSPAHPLMSIGDAAPIIHMVRNFEDRINVDELVNSLVANEFTISSKMAGLAKEVSERILAKFPQVKGIVLLGSSVHGGARIREATKSHTSPDFDWGIISDGTLSWSESVEVILEAEQDLPALAKRYGLSGDFHSCESINPEQCHVTVLETPQDFINLVTSKRYAASSTDIPLYLQPSFPPQVNERNRDIVKEGLAELRATSESKYETGVEAIMESWLKMHLLKEKHFEIARKRKDRALLNKVTAASAEKMSEPVKDVLTPVPETEKVAA